MDGVIVNKLRKINHPKGDILKVIKKSDKSFSSFGEVYFSKINQASIKGWKKHKRMHLNLVVPIGEVKFVIYNEKSKKFFSINISEKNNKRLTVKAGLWVAFRGVGKYNVLLNIASIEHDPKEILNLNIDEISYQWDKNN